MATATYFHSESFEFLRQLKRNNRREWFTGNKSRYEEFLAQPALAFIRDFSPHIEKISPHFVADPRPARGSLFRIYRDTRFSANKDPYKTHVGIHFSHAAGKDPHAPVFYLHLEPENCFVAGGIWQPDNRALTMPRTTIAKCPERWAAVRRRLTIEGESLSRLPRGFDSADRFVEDLKRKDFVSTEALTATQICGDKFMREFVTSCKRLTPLVEFTCFALKLKF